MGNSIPTRFFVVKYMLAICLPLFFFSCGMIRGIQKSQYGKDSPAIGGLPSAGLVSKRAFSNLRECLEANGLNYTSLISGQLKTSGGILRFNEIRLSQASEPLDRCKQLAIQSYQRDVSSIISFKFDPLKSSYIYEVEAHLYPEPNGKVWPKEIPQVTDDF